MRRRISAAYSFEQALTLIELLVVITIICILAALLPRLGGNSRAPKKVAEGEEANLVAAINEYYAEYGHLPVSSNAVAASGTNDFTFGTVSHTPAGSGQLSSLTVDTPGENVYQNYNSEVIAILRDDNFWPEANGVQQHIYNPHQTPFFNARVAPDTNSPGIGPDGIFRDPWGSPYIITMDLNNDHKCYDATLDAMYVLETNTPVHLLVPGEAIVWSLGPLKTIDLSQALEKGANKQTIITSF